MNTETEGAEVLRGGKKIGIVKLSLNPSKTKIEYGINAYDRELEQGGRGIRPRSNYKLYSHSGTESERPTRHLSNFPDPRHYQQH